MKRTQRFTRPNPGKVFENLTEQSIMAYGFMYSRENVARMGRKASKGRFDFTVHADWGKLCFDCKSTGKNAGMQMPPMKSAMVKTHQLLELRKEYAAGHIAGLLLEYRHVNKIYWLSIESLGKLHASEGLVAAITPMHCEQYGKEVPVVEGVMDLEAIK